MRTWMKCLDEECSCTWYTDSDDCFDGCPECGGVFDIINVEPSPTEQTKLFIPYGLEEEFDGFVDIALTSLDAVSRNQLTDKELRIVSWMENRKYKNEGEEEERG